MPVPAAPRGICGDGAQQAQTEPADAGSPDGELPDEAQEESEPDAAAQAAQALLDALPEEVTADTAEEVAAQLAAIDEALAELDGEQLAQLDLARYESLCEALTTLTAEQAGEHTHYLCGSDTCTGLGGHTEGKEVTFQEWTSDNSLPTSGAYCLTKNVTVTAETKLAGELTLCLNGFTVTANGDFDILNVDLSGRDFTLFDCTGGGKITRGNGAGYTVYVHGSPFYMYGGNIYGNTVSDHGGGVYTASDSTFTMRGGEITGNKALNSSVGVSHGGGVYVHGRFQTWTRPWWASTTGPRGRRRWQSSRRCGTSSTAWGC